MGFFDRFRRRPRGSLGLALVVPELVSPGARISVRVRMTADGGEVAVAALRVKLFRQSMRDDVDGSGRYELEGSPVSVRVVTTGLVIGEGETVEREVELVVPDDAILPDVPSTRQLHRVEVVAEVGAETVEVQEPIKVADEDHDEDEDDEDDEGDENDDEEEDDEDDEPPAMTPETHPHELGTWLERFRAMVDELRADPRVEVLRFDTYAPVDEARLAAWELELGHVVPEDVKTFYRQSDGLALAWRPRGTGTGADVDGWHPHDYGQPEGHVKLLPIDLLFVHPLPDDDGLDEDATIEFRGVAHDGRTFRRRSFVLDPYSFSASALLVLGEPDGAWVLRSDGHDTDLESARPVDFGSYLELVLGVRGCGEARHRWLAADRHADTRDFEDTYTPAAYWRSRGLAPSSPGWAGTFPKVLEVARGWPRRDLKSFWEDDDTDWRRALARHEKWLARGGKLDGWRIFDVSGLPLLVPQGLVGDSDQHLDLRLPGDLARSGVSFARRRLPYLGLPCVNARGLDATGADLTLGVFMDGDFDGADFSGADLKACDFSRASMRGAVFHGTELGGVDFEGADLTGADFTGSTWRLASFRGARLDGAIIDHPSPRAPARRAFSTPSIHLIDMLLEGGVAFVTFGDPPREDLGLVLERSPANVAAFFEVQRRFALRQPGPRGRDDELSPYQREFLAHRGNDGLIMPMGAANVHRRSYEDDLARGKPLDTEGLSVVYRPYPHYVQDEDPDAVTDEAD